MANVIDRLRVQGNPAPRNLSEPTGLNGLAGKRKNVEEGSELNSNEPTVQVIIRHPHLQNRDSNSGRLMNQTARRMDHLQRVQYANQGLSTMDIRQPDLQGKQFLLRGKPASAEVALLNRHSYLQQQQDQASSLCSGSGKSSRRVARTGQSHSDSEGILPPSRKRGNPPIRCRGAKTEESSDLPSGQSLPASSSASAYFVLGNPNTIPKGPDRVASPGTSLNSRASGRRQAFDPKSAGSGATLELTGRQVMTPRSNTAGYDDGITFRELYTRSPRYGRPGFKSPGLKDSTLDQPVPDPESLQQCLHVQPSAQQYLAHQDASGDAALRLRRFGGSGGGGGSGLQSSSSSRPPGTTETKINYNNPYRQTRSKERKPLPESERRYIFDSVASYIHFNKIYPKRKEAGAGSSSGHALAPNRRHPHAKLGMGGIPVQDVGMPKIPHMTGFPSHCTDTILLKMMFEMNKPGTVHGIGLGHQAAGAPSIRSTVSTKYSDIGRHRDLDEFLIRGETPSTCSIRNTSSHLHNYHQPPPAPQTSQRSGGTISFHAIPSPPKEEDEDIGQKSRDGHGNHQDEEQDDVDEGQVTKRTEGDESTLRTATAPGRHLPDENAEDADDEASEWTVRVAGKGGKGVVVKLPVKNEVGVS